MFVHELRSEMRKTINLLYKPFVRGFYLFITISTIFACSQNKPDQHDTSKKENKQKTPVAITGKAPVVTLLDTCPSPLTITIPQKTADSYSIKTEAGSKTIQILPPEKRSAGFFVPMQNFTTRNGLTNNRVQTGYVDKNGNLWFGTFGGGVSRYDGKSFTNYTNIHGLANNNVMTIFEDKSGNLWFGTWGGGVSRYDGKSFRNYTTKGLADDIVWAIIEDNNGNIWFGTWEGGISRYDGESFTNFTAQGLVSNHTRCMLLDKSGNIWIGTWDAGVSCWDSRSLSFINYTAADGLANNAVGSILEDQNGNLWVGNGRGKISFLDSKKKLPGKKPKFTNYTIAEGLPLVQTITEDKQGNLWFGTGEGAFQLSWNKKSIPGKEDFTSISTQQGLPNNKLNSIVEDKNGNMWFGSDDGGVSVLRGDLKFLTSLTTNDVLLNTGVSSLLEDKAGNVWVGTLGEGALRLSRDSKSISKYTTSQGLPDNIVLNIFEDKRGNIWFGCPKAVARLDQDGKSFTNYTTAQGLSGLPDSNWVINIFEDKRGNFWFGTWGSGVSRLSSDSKSLTTYTTAQGLPGNVVKKIFEDKGGNLWLGTDRGLSRLDQDGKSFTNYTIEQGLSNNDVWDILEDQNGNLWFGTNGGGISRYDGKSFISFTTAQGLSDDQVRDIAMDKTGIIWLGTYKGFTALKGFVQDLKDTLNHLGQKNLQPSNELSNGELESNNFKPVFEIYNIKTGYPIEEITSDILVTREGIIWAGVGTREKTVRFDYSSIHKNPNPSAVFLQSIKINNEVISWYDLSHEEEKTESFLKTPNGMEEITQFGKILDEEQRQAMRKKFSSIKFDSITRFYPVPVNLVLPYEHNNITFDFIAIEPARPGFVRYQYMMEGYENEWSPVSEKTNATYGNIREGSYTFKVKAQSPDGIWSSPLTYTFKVLPPWYRTWWFIITAVGCLITLFYLVIRWRLHQKFRKQLERSEKEKQFAELQHKTVELEMQALRAQMNPHFIFNSLNSVNMFILENNKSQASEYLSKFSRLVRLILHHSQESFIPLDRELEALQLYLELESLRFEKRFDYKISVKDIDTTMTKVPPLIIQPYAENAIWHGLMQKKEKGHLEIEIYGTEKILFCKITDDGIGRDRAAELKSKSSLPHKSLGMRITADRLAMLQQQEKIETPIVVKDLVLPDGRAAGTEVLIKLPFHYD